ncbi:uncharacterized protein LOC135843325 [Planococcus citri]|uniref:uncharacterized protein LOC135843325 n=1 Tax=Planococcus citri TaxID=170843 RepID=UPI0031F8EA0C
MEKLYVKNVISNLFAYRSHIFGEGSTYYGFEPKTSDQNGDQKLPDGFNSDHQYGKILYKNKDGDILKSGPVMIKFSPKACFTRWILFSFTNEMIFYTKILPVLNTPEVSVLGLFPKFYHGEIIFDVEQDHSALVLEDLTFKGYRMAEKKSFLDYQHLALMMRKLGQFHAHSYKAKNTVPDLFYPLANNFQEAIQLMNGEYTDVLAKVGQRGLQQLQTDSAYSAYIPMITEMIQRSDDIFKQILTEGNHDAVSVIVHGDYLRNNVMFKYKNTNTPEPDDLVMLDMARYRYGSPVIDLVTVMYLHADQEMRNKHWNDLVDEYYTSLKETFPENPVPSKDEILSEFVEKSFFGYFVASYFLPLLIADDNNTHSADVYECLSASDEVSPSIDTLVDSMTKILLAEGGNEASQVLGDILRDLIDRGFICKKSA